jgi:hypothetical protein
MGAKDKEPFTTNLNNSIPGVLAGSRSLSASRNGAKIRWDWLKT